MDYGGRGSQILKKKFATDLKWVQSEEKPHVANYKIHRTVILLESNLYNYRAYSYIVYNRLVSLFFKAFNYLDL